MMIFSEDYLFAYATYVLSNAFSLAKEKQVPVLKMSIKI